jgi:hypothetical protein
VISQRAALWIAAAILPLPIRLFHKSAFSTP